MKRLQVLHVIPSVAPQRGGPSRAVVDMVTALNATDSVEARILTTNDDGPGRLPVACDDWVEHDGVPVWFLDRYSPAFAPVREFAYAAGLSTWLVQHAHTYDVIHVHALFSYLSSFSMAYARKRGLPYVARPIGQLGDWSLSQRRLKKRAYLALLEQRNLQGAACLHFTSELERDEASHLGLRPPAEVIPLGVFAQAPSVGGPDDFARRFGRLPDTPKVVFLGRLHEKKGLEDLFKAVALLEQPVQLLVAGTGTQTYVASLRLLTRTLGIEHCVHWLGFVDGADKQLLLAHADLFALTSHAENFGIAVVEALAAGTPVLVTRGVALAGFVEQQGLGHSCDLDTDAIARALAQGLSEPARPSAKTRAAIQSKTLQAFGWPGIAGQLVAMYQRLAGGTQRV